MLQEHEPIHPEESKARILYTPDQTLMYSREILRHAGTMFFIPYTKEERLGNFLQLRNPKRKIITEFDSSDEASYGDTFNRAAARFLGVWGDPKVIIQGEQAEKDENPKVSIHVLRKNVNGIQEYTPTLKVMFPSEPLSINYTTVTLPVEDLKFNFRPFLHFPKGEELRCLIKYLAFAHTEVEDTQPLPLSRLDGERIAGHDRIFKGLDGEWNIIRHKQNP